MSQLSDARPDPAALLAEANRERRGALKVFLGASPGVGKTYKMLEAAQESARQGLDVVIGVVESHGRAETEALCAGLETLPLAPIEYRGTQFKELDLDGLLRRAPAVALVDELAHRNIPGTRHARRWQDIEELLAAGIDCWTTLNVQHLESLNDVVAKITGVRMRETVPDALLANADLVLVDLTPRELTERLRQGKVYVPEQARAAMDGFFSLPNLAALRELTLQTVAERIDQDVRESMRRQGLVGPWPVRARVVVAVDGIGNGEELIRLGSRLAGRRRAPWSAVYVERGEADPEREAGVERAFQLAERLGGETVRLRGHDAVAELLDFARERNATTLVVGRSHRRPIAGLLGRTLSQRLLRDGTDLEITFVASATQRAHRPRLRVVPSGTPWHYVFAALVVAAAVGIGLLILPLLPLANLSLVFMLAVMLVAVRTAMGPAVFAGIASALAYNFFFTAPHYSFAIHNPHDLLTVSFFLVMALIGGHIAGRLRNQLLALRRTNEQTRSLLDLSRRLAAAPDLDTVRREAALAISAQARVPTILLVPQGETGLLALAPGSPGHPLEVHAAGAPSLEGPRGQAPKGEPVLDERDRAAAQWAYDHRQPSGFRTETLAGVPWRFLPLVYEQECFGVVGLFLGASPPLGGEVLTLVDVLVSQAVLALVRTGLVSSLAQARVGEETERLRSALLSSVSHDLRTPLASMIGAASSLRTLGSAIPESERAELLDAVLSEGERLDRYIQNLLDMTRLGHGTLKLTRDWIGIDDIAGSALRRTAAQLAHARVVRRIAPGLPLLYVHPALIEQALVNVIENAARFSPPGGEVTFAAQRVDRDLAIEISDQGPGIPPQDRARVFDPFFTAGDGDMGQRTGLGLAICHGMIGAHGGRIEARPGPDGRGTTIAIRLPLPEPATGAEK
jgi:two-component system sensor histidine kinase KdpD